MIKKIILFAILEIVGFWGGYNIVLANGDLSYSEEFISHLVACKQYREETPIDFFGATITPILTVHGWRNGKCMYSNYEKEAPESKYTCYFTKSQLQEIYEVSKQDQTQQATYTGDGLKYTVDPLSVLFTKYMNDGVTCVIPD